LALCFLVLANTLLAAEQRNNVSKTVLTCALEDSLTVDSLIFLPIAHKSDSFYNAK